MSQYMIRRKQRKIPFDELNGTYRADYGSAIPSGFEAVLNDFDEE